MFCPNCGSAMNLVNLDGQPILHCSHCGASFFEENGINRISVSSAQKLASEEYAVEISGALKKCPRDQETLSPIQDNEAIPSHVTLLSCKKCKGIFVYPDDLLNFKTAQRVKIDFFKLWNKPLPSLRVVMVLSFLAVVSLSLFSSFNNFYRKTATTTQASDLIKNVYFFKSGRYLMVSFATKTQFKSSIIFIDRTENKTTEKVVSSDPKTIHQLTITDVNTGNELTYQIALTDQYGKQTKLEEKKVIVTNQ